MRKIKTLLVMAAAAVLNLTLLSFVPGCTESASEPMSASQFAVTPSREIFPLATYTSEFPISRDAQNYGRLGNVAASRINGPSGLLGYSIEAEVVSRSGPFGIRVLLDSQLYVKKATVISYPWSRGRDVRKLAFTKQFQGKGPSDSIKLGDDIDAMTGATISSRVMTEGIRNIKKLMQAETQKNSL